LIAERCSFSKAIFSRPSFPREKLTAASNPSTQADILASRPRGGTLVVMLIVMDILRLVSDSEKISEKLAHAQAIDTRLSLPPHTYEATCDYAGKLT